MRTAETILEIIHERGKRGLPLERVYRLLYNQELYLAAYAKISQNKGALTPGATVETADGMNLNKIQNIIEALKYERYKFSPVRRVYIEKKNSRKLRPLGIPTWSDKLVQEVIRIILEAYYEPQFSESSHGFRPQRGCHTALKEIANQWTGTAWFIEGDIKGCFDNIEHEVLINILSQKIKDNRFLNLIGQLLKAGYLENWKYNQTYSGSPQGGIVSPLLSNIYLNELDRYVEQQLIPTYTKGKLRARNRTYEAYRSKATYLKRKGLVQEAKRWDKLSRQLPSKDPNDPEYRRLRYVRYADDFILGFAGPKTEADKIKENLTKFLSDKLKLELSSEKTLITHGRTGRAKFLGYEISIGQNDTYRDKVGKRGVNGQIRFHVPVNKVNEFLKPYRLKGKTRRRPELLNESDFHIIRHYQSVFKGFAEYYKYAGDRSLRLKKAKMTLEQSLVLTLANKYKTRVSKIYQKYVKVVNGYKCLQITVDRQDKKSLTATWGGISLAHVKTREQSSINDQIKYLYSGSVDILDRLLANKCELCGSQENVQVHHIRALKDLRKFGQQQKPAWVIRMAERQRKTLVVCRKCHHQIHQGKFDGNVE